MSKDLNVSKPAGGSPAPRRRNPRAMLRVINGVLVGVGTLYLATGSVIMAAIGAVVAVVLAALHLCTPR